VWCRSAARALARVVVAFVFGEGGAAHGGPAAGVLSRGGGQVAVSPPGLLLAARSQLGFHLPQLRCLFLRCTWCQCCQNSPGRGGWRGLSQFYVGFISGILGFISGVPWFYLGVFASLTRR